MLHEIYYETKHIEKSIVPVRQRCRNIKFKPIQGRIKIYSCSFLPNTINEWNNLPIKCTSLVDLSKFKKEIEGILMDWSTIWMWGCVLWRVAYNLLAWMGAAKIIVGNSHPDCDLRSAFQVRVFMWPTTSPLSVHHYQSCGATHWYFLNGLVVWSSLAG